MASWRHSLYGLILGCWLLGGADRAAAQVSPTAPDTVAARRIVDSLVSAGAWHLPAKDTVRIPLPTGDTGSTGLNAWLRVLAFIAGIALLTGLGVATYAFARRFFSALDRRSPIGVRSHWGGFGGGDSGWEASPALSLLAATLVLATLTAAVAGAMLAGGSASPQGRPGTQGQGASQQQTGTQGSTTSQGRWAEGKPQNPPTDSLD